MARPMLYTISAFDATKDNTFRFMYTGVIAKVNALFYDNDTGKLVYGTDKFYITQKTEYALPANSLKNAVTGYKVKICVYDTDDVQSAYSDTRLFYCKSAPTFVFSTIQNVSGITVIPTSAYETSISYNSTDQELLKDYYIYLCDSSKSVIRSSAAMYEPDEIYTIPNLIESNTYYLRATGETVNGMLLDTGYIQVLVNYTKPKGYSQVIAQNRYNSGDILVRSYIISIDGESIKTAKYIIDGNDMLIDLSETGAGVIYDKGYVLDGSFSLGVKVSSANVNKCVIELSDEENNSLCKVNFCSRIVNDVQSYFAELQCGNYISVSNIITDIGKRFVIGIERENELFSVGIQKVE